jgi:hypothetical protein
LISETLKTPAKRGANPVSLKAAGLSQPRKRIMKKLLFLVVAIAFAPLVASAAQVDEEVVTKTLVWPDGTRYVGGVADGKRTGKGTIFWQDGTRFVGQFENDMRNGPGTMILPDGTVYTGYFRDDELVDTEETIALSSAAAAGELDGLEDTELPMEADGLGDEPEPEAVTRTAPSEIPIEEVPVPQEQAPEELLAEAQTPEEKAEEKAETAALEIAAVETPVEPDPTVPTEAATDVPTDMPAHDPFGDSDITEITEAVKSELIETIDLWAAAWSDQNVNQYLAYYSDEFSVPGRQNRRTWEALRRSRLSRPSYINLDVTYQRFDLVETNIVDVFFRQTYRSNTYSDLTDKVLRMRKEDTDWKILVERSR